MKSTSKKILLLSTVGILILSFLPTVRAAKTYVRSIDDWMVNNPYGSSWGYGGFDRGADDYTYRIFFAEDYDLNFYEFEYHGFVHEKEQSDGSLKYTVHLVAKDVYIEVYNMNWDLVLIGTISFLFKFEFLLYASYPGGDTWWGPVEGGTREPGTQCELPFIFLIWFFLSQSSS